MKKAIATTQAPAAIGPYSQAIEAGNTVYVSGQLPINPATGEFAEGGMAELTRQSLTNIKNILAEVGLMNAAYAEFFTGVAPARSAVAVKTLPKNARVEIECIAVK